MELDEIIRTIAKENGVTPEEVYREMQDCINDAYSRAPEGSAAKIKQNSVPRKGEIPTPEELIEYVVEEMRRLERAKLILIFNKTIKSFYSAAYLPQNRCKRLKMQSIRFFGAIWCMKQRIYFMQAKRSAQLKAGQ